MTQAWIVSRWDGHTFIPEAVFATHEEADAYVRLDPHPSVSVGDFCGLGIDGPVPVGLVAMGRLRARG